MGHTALWRSPGLPAPRPRHKSLSHRGLQPVLAGPGACGSPRHRGLALWALFWGKEAKSYPGPPGASHTPWRTSRSPEQRPVDTRGQLQCLWAPHTGPSKPSVVHQRGHLKEVPGWVRASSIVCRHHLPVPATALSGTAHLLTSHPPTLLCRQQTPAERRQGGV